MGWEHPDRGLLGPADLLGLAARHGLVDELTAVVLRRSLAQAAALRDGRRRRVGVDVSARCLLDPRLVTTVAVLLAEHQVALGDLVLEIAETGLMLDAEVSRRVVADLVGLGVEDGATLHRWVADHRAASADRTGREVHHHAGSVVPGA